MKHTHNVTRKIWIDMWQKGHNHHLALLFARYVYLSLENFSLCINFSYSDEKKNARNINHTYTNLCVYILSALFFSSIISHRLIDMNTHSVWLTFEMFSHPPLFPFTTNRRFLCTWFFFLLRLLLLFLRLIFCFTLCTVLFEMILYIGYEARIELI